MKKQLFLLIICMVLVSLSFISAISITDVSSVPEEVAPGEIIDISIKVKNIFEDDMYNLNVKLDLEDVPFAPYQSSSEEFLEELEEGDREDFKFKLIVLPETASGIYKVPVEITYEDNNGNSSSKEELISIIVNSNPELKISLEDPVKFIRGRENIFPIKIVNSGLSDVKFIYITVSDTGGVKFLSEREQYLGDIDSDDFDSIEYTVYINENALGTINLPVILKFRDATNKEFTETKFLSLRTYSLKQAQELGFVKKPNYAPYIGVGVLLLLYIIRRILKKRKLNRARR